MSPPNPRVSIGIPVYNGERFLSAAIESALAQTFTDFEIVLSDNASSDGTEALCRAYAARDTRIRYIRQSENIGAHRNFQFVTATGVGRYTTWLASDDLLEPEFLARAVAYLDAHPACVLVAVDVAIIDEHDVRTDVERLDLIRDDVAWERRIREFFTFPIANTYFCIYGMMRTEACKQVLGATPPPRFVQSSELPLLARFAALGEMAALPGILRQYRRHSNSMFVQAKAGESAGRVWAGLASARRRLHWQLRQLRIALLSDLPGPLKRAAIGEVFGSGVRSLRNLAGRLSHRGSSA